MNNTPVHIFFSVHNDCCQQLCVTLCSIIQNNPNTALNFYVMHTSVSTINQTKIVQFIKQFKQANIRFIKIDTKLLLKLNITDIPTETYYRFLIPQLVPELAKAIYLDCDLVVNGNLETLWNTGIHDYYLAGVKDLYLYKQQYPEQLELTDKDVYINDGVLLLNLDKMRKDDLTTTLFQNITKYARQIQYPAQDIINITCKGKIKQLDSIYNFTTEHQLVEPSKFPDAKIIHWNGEDKPWNLQECRSPLTSLYFKYLSNTPYVPKVKIFAFYHRPSYIFHTDCLEPMQNGAETTMQLLPMLRDNTGDNISNKNINYAELTGNYWVWKNWLPAHPETDYIGFCHYRRFLDFNIPATSPRCFAKRMDCFAFAQQYNHEYTAAKIYNHIKNADVILPELHHLSACEGNIYQQFINNHPKEEIDKLISIIKTKYPQMQPDMDCYLQGNTGYFCLNYVMKRSLFDDFMTWTFDCLCELEKQTVWEKYTDYLNQKTPAYLLERFFNIWLRYQIRINHIKIQEQESIILDGAQLTEPKPIIKKYFPGVTVTKYPNVRIWNIFGLQVQKNKLPDGDTTFSANLFFKIPANKALATHHTLPHQPKNKLCKRTVFFPGIFLDIYQKHRILHIGFIKIKFFVNKTPEFVHYYRGPFSWIKYTHIGNHYKEHYIKYKNIKLVATLLVRDEIDIIEENIKFHLQQGVDFIIATDNGSIDGTRDVLLKYQNLGVLHLIDEPDQNYNQVLWVDRMIQLAKKKYKADWIINLDADEFWFSQAGNLKKDLMLLDKFNTVYVPSLYMYPEKNKPADEPFYYNTKGQYRLLMKCIHRTKGYKKIYMGSHDVVMRKKVFTTYSGIALFHYFMRSYNQFEYKTRISGRALRKNKSLKGQGKWMLDLYQEYLRGNLPAEYNKRLLNEYNSYVYDSRMKDYYLNKKRTQLNIFKNILFDVSGKS